MVAGGDSSNYRINGFSLKSMKLEIILSKNIIQLDREVISKLLK